MLQPMKVQVVVVNVAANESATKQVKANMQPRFRLNANMLVNSFMSYRMELYIVLHHIQDGDSSLSSYSG